MQLLQANTHTIEQASQVIKNGGLVAFPTETVYGLGANGFNPTAVAKIFEAKSRPKFNPLILHICDVLQIEQISSIDLKSIENLVTAFFPGPLTLVVPKKNIVPDIVTAGNLTVAVRMPNHKIALDLIKSAGVPIAAPSANKFGKLSPTTANHVAKQLKDKVDIILDGGQCSVGVESTIIEISGNDYYLLRHGGLSTEDIEKVLGKKLLKKENSKNPIAPGQLLFHYAPNIPIKFLDKTAIEENKDKKIGALLFSEKYLDYNFAVKKSLTATNSYIEAASNLFYMLHELEYLEIDIILAEPIPEIGLGKAIMDRLKKAVNTFK
ncbi:MAG: L-threonylcarbamoyladenylate synthase [bacterium]